MLKNIRPYKINSFILSLCILLFSCNGRGVNDKISNNENIDNEAIGLIEDSLFMNLTKEQIKVNGYAPVDGSSYDYFKIGEIVNVNDTLFSCMSYVHFNEHKKLSKLNVTFTSSVSTIPLNRLEMFEKTYIGKKLINSEVAKINYDTTGHYCKIIYAWE